MTECCDKQHDANPQVTVAPSPTGSATFRIPTMDCASEEADIRRALENVPGIRSLNFQLVARTLAIDASPEAIPAAVEAIGKAGYKMLPLAPVEGGQRAPGNDEHGVSTGVTRLVGALVLAGTAEALSFFAPDALPWNLAGMAVALVAIYLAGLDVYKKGLTALFKLKLNINALMTVAVTGAFLIGQWPEAAMVMALYSIAELIEVLAVDRARNAIKGLLAMAPARIIHAVEQAQATRAPTQKFVDRFAAIYTPAVFSTALGIALLTPFILDWTWTQALYKALVLLVIACPCALVISTPVTVVSGLAAAARRGILIKGGTYLEDARRLWSIGRFGSKQTGTMCARSLPACQAAQITLFQKPSPPDLTLKCSLWMPSPHLQDAVCWAP